MNPIVLKQLKKYVDWYSELSTREKVSDVGQWIRENIKRYCMVINDDL